MRRRHRSRQSAGDIAEAFEVQRDECDDEIRRYEAIAIVDDAEAIGVAVGGESQIVALGQNQIAKLDEIFFVALRREAAEIWIAEVVDDFDFEAGLEQEVIEVIARSAVERVDGDAQS